MGRVGGADPDAEPARIVEAAREDVASVDAIVEALYDAVSFEPNAEPD